MYLFLQAQKEDFSSAEFLGSSSADLSVAKNQPLDIPNTANYGGSFTYLPHTSSSMSHLKRGLSLTYFGEQDYQQKTDLTFEEPDAKCI